MEQHKVYVQLCYLLLAYMTTATTTTTIRYISRVNGFCRCELFEKEFKSCEINLIKLTQKNGNLNKRNEIKKETRRHGGHCKNFIFQDQYANWRGCIFNSFCATRGILHHATRKKRNLEREKISKLFLRSCDNSQRC